MTIIITKNLKKHYQQGNKSIRAVDGVDLSIESEDFAVVVGPSGCGKSTLLQLIGGLDRPTEGTIVVNKVDVTRVNDRKLTQLRRESIGFVFQNFNLIPTLTASENVEAAIAKHSGNDRKRVTELLASVGLGQRINHLPTKLSGGEQQRVALARALINEPALILADEPTGNLDSATGEEILNLLKTLNREKKKTIMLITHNDYAKKFATTVYHMKDGQIRQ